MAFSTRAPQNIFLNIRYNLIFRRLNLQRMSPDHVVSEKRQKYFEFLCGIVPNYAL